MDADPDVKRLQCLHDLTHTRTQWINQAAAQWKTWIYISRFFFKSTENNFFPYSQNIMHNCWITAKPPVIHYQTEQVQSKVTELLVFLFLTTAGVVWMLCIFYFNPCTEVFVWKHVQWEIRCFTAITANKIISTSGRTQYCTNTTPSHPQYDGVTTQILSVNMNWTTKNSTVHAWRASYSSFHAYKFPSIQLNVTGFFTLQEEKCPLYLTQADKKYSKCLLPI